MHNHMTKIHIIALSLTIAVLACFGFTSPQKSEASNDNSVTTQKQEIKKNVTKRPSKKQLEEAQKAEEAKKAEEAQKAEEAKKAEEARKAEEAKKLTPDKKKYGAPNGYQVMTDGRIVNFRSMGVIYMHGYRYTYYSSKVLYHHKTHEWYACDDHLYRTADGYIVVASRDHAFGAIVPTPFGPGKVLDRCVHSGNIDIYVNF